MIGSGRRIVTESVDCEMVTKYNPIFFAKFYEYLVNLCDYSDQKHDFLYINVCQVPKPRAPPSVSNISLGTWQTLMHEKTCLNSILEGSIFNSPNDK